MVQSAHRDRAVALKAPVFQIAAESLAKGLGTKLGEEIGGAAGKAIANAIFGTRDEDGFKVEVSAKLAVIEQKLDALILFFHEQLPGVVHKQVTLVLLDQQVFQMKAQRESLTSYILAFQTSHNANNVDSLRDSAENIVSLGYALAQNGPQFYGPTLEAFISFVSGYSRLMQSSKQREKEFAPSLIHWAQKYSELAEDWLKSDNANPNLPRNLLKTKTDELEKASQIISQTPIGTYLLFVEGPLLNDDPPAPGTEVTDRKWMGMPAWSVRQENWGGDWGHGRQRPLIFKGGVVPKPEEWEKAYGWKILDFAPPRYDLTSRDQAGGWFNEVNRRINEAQLRKHLWPTQIAELTKLVQTLEYLRDASVALAEPEKKTSTAALVGAARRLETGDVDSRING